MSEINQFKLKKAKRYVEHMNDANKERINPRGSQRVINHCEELACRIEDEFKSGATYQEDFEFYIELAEQELKSGWKSTAGASKHPNPGSSTS